MKRAGKASSIDVLREMRATAMEGAGLLRLEFEAGFDDQRALNDVRERVDIAKAELPANSEEPIVRETNASLYPVLSVMLHGDVPERMLVTLGMALLFVPTVGALIGRRRDTPSAVPHRGDGDTPAPEADPESMAAAHGGTAAYIRLLRTALAHPAKVLAVAVAVLAGSVVLYGSLGRGFEFFPEVEPDTTTLYIHARGDLSVDESDLLVRAVEERILDMPELDSVYALSGIGLGVEGQVDVIGRIHLDFVDFRLRRPVDELVAEIRSRTSDLAGVVVAPSDWGVLGAGKPIQIELSSQRPELLGDAVARLRAGMDEIGGLVDVTDSRPVPGIDWTMDVDREQAARFGASIATVGNAIQLVTNGALIGEYRPDDTDDEVEIRLRFPESDRSLSQLERLRVTSAGASVPVGNFVTRVAAPRAGNLLRADSRRILTVSADVADGTLVDDKVGDIEEWLARGELDPEVRVAFRGENEEQRESEAFLLRAFAVALFLMGIILVAQFNSFYQAFLVLTAVIFSTVGVLLGLMATNQPFGVVMSGVGIIALAGIVVNNNIVLIDTYNAIRRAGQVASGAALFACSQRLRPVLLTTATTILGLMPMVLGLNIDLLGRSVEVGGPMSQWWAQLATAVAGGLAFATLLTLVLTPCLLVLGDRVG